MHKEYFQLFYNFEKIMHSVINAIIKNIVMRVDDISKNINKNNKFIILLLNI